MKVLLILFLSASSALAAPWNEQVIAAVLLGEARGEGKTGMIAVGEVIHQRSVETGKVPVQVVASGFSSRIGKTNVEMVRQYSREAAWNTALEIAQTVCQQPEKLPGITKGANAFDHRKSNPPWKRKARLVAVVKNHAFYRIEL
jgi:spore germination cell wall hydrolase CwlJ-like protein